MSHYISLTEAERAEMLKAVGVESTADLFVDVPAELRFPRLDLPEPMSEIELVRELQRLSASDAHAHSHSIFLGAGAFADEKPFRAFIPDAEHGLGARLVQSALCTSGHGALQFGPVHPACGGFTGLLGDGGVVLLGLRGGGVQVTAHPEGRQLQQFHHAGARRHSAYPIRMASSRPADAG